MNEIMGKKLAELNREKSIIVSLMFIDEFIAYCNERGHNPKLGRILYEENARFVYL